MPETSAMANGSPLGIVLLLIISITVDPNIISPTARAFLCVTALSLTSTILYSDAENSCVSESSNLLFFFHFLTFLFDYPPARIAPSILSSFIKQIINAKENTIKFK